MIVTRGLGRPGNLLTSSGLGRILRTTPDGNTYIYDNGTWHLVTGVYVHDGVTWVQVPTMYAHKGGDWVRVWG